jgi:hypothetical protein
MRHVVDNKIFKSIIQELFGDKKSDFNKGKKLHNMSFSVCLCHAHTAVFWRARTVGTKIAFRAMLLESLYICHVFSVAIAC